VDALGGAAAVTVERSISDTKAITFAWPVSGATITGTRSIDNAAYGAVTGAIAFLRTETGKHYYTLAYNVADRPSVEGQVRYKFVDGLYTRYVVLRVEIAVLDSTATAALVDLIWDEPLTRATHNVATSAGKRLRQTTAFQQIDSTVVDAAATTTTFATDLDSAVDNFYNDSMLVFTDGALAGQVRAIYDYVGSTKTIILEEALTSAPVNGVAFAIVSLHIHPVSQIQSGLATASALATAKTILDKVDTGLVVDGAVYQFTANMLELGPSGGGGSSVNVLPATGIVADRSAGTTLLPVVGETISQSITVYQSDGTTAVSLSGKTLKVIFETMSGVDVAVVLAADITISGASSNVVTFAYPSAVTASERTLKFAIRDAAAPLTMYLQGVCSVVAAPKVDA
jgi:hypothetical protein